MSDSTPTARTTVRSDADAIRYSSSAVLPIPASPRNTSDRLSPRRIAETNSPSRAHSLARPRRPAGPASSRERPSIATDPRRHEPHIVDFNGMRRDVAPRDLQLIPERLGAGRIVMEIRVDAPGDNLEALPDA